VKSYPRIAILTTPDREGHEYVLGHVTGIRQDDVAELMDLAVTASLARIGLGDRPRPKCYSPAFRLVVEDEIGAMPCLVADAAEYVAAIVTRDMVRERAA
jgi:hypothetical protein